MASLWRECVSLALLCACAHGNVINGSPASVEDYPQVASYGTCVATLISERWAISAAYCYRPWYTTLTVLHQPSGRRRRTLRRSVVHPDYRLGDNFDAKGYRSEVYATWDYLLLELRTPLRTARFLRALDVTEPPPGTKASFPSLKPYESEKMNETLAPLYQGELFTISDEECARRLQSFDSVTMMCAEGRAPKHSGACHGDSGGGLVAEGRLLGVLSWVEGDARDCGADRVVVAARLSSQPVQEWIRNVTSGAQAPAKEGSEVVPAYLIEKARTAVPSSARVV